MHTWHIQKLKQQLIKGPLSQKESFSYVLAVTFFYTMLSLIFATAAFYSPLPVILIYILIFFATKFICIPLCYNANGGMEGKDFMMRYFSMAWVQIVRFFAGGSVIVIVGLFIVELFVGNGAFRSPHFIFIGVFILLWQVIYYWRLLLHFRELAQ